MSGNFLTGEITPLTANIKNVSKAINAFLVALWHVCPESIKLNRVLSREKKALIEMYLIAALRMASSPLLNIWVCSSCSVINFQHCRTLSFLCPVIHSSYMPEKCQVLLGVRRKRAVAVSVQLAESEDPQPALWVRYAFRLCWSADQSHIKRRCKLILLFYYAIG